MKCPAIGILSPKSLATSGKIPIITNSAIPNPVSYTHLDVYKRQTVVGTIRWGWTNSASAFRRSSGTVITPTLGSIVQKGKFAA